MARVVKAALENIYRHAAVIPFPILVFLLPDHRRHIVTNMCIYTHI